MLQGCSLALLAAVLAVVFPPVAAGGGGGPVFTLKQKYLDNWEFWSFFAGMVFYGLLIDRIQYFALKQAEKDRCRKMIAERCMTEFMVFGIVGLSLFTLGELYPGLPSKQNTYLTFCDVWVSFAACFLILLGAIYDLLRHRVDGLLEKYHAEDDFTPSVLGWHPVTADMQKIFMSRHALNSIQFNWGMYFVQSLTLRICDLININWISWLLIFLMILPIVGYKYVSGPADNFMTYIIGYAALYWGLVLVSLVTYLAIRSRRKALYRSLERCVESMDADDNDSDESSQEAEDLDELCESAPQWNSFMAQVLQVEATLSCFFLGIYVLHLLYNLSKDDVLNDVLFNAMFVTAVFLTMGVLGPASLLELASCQAFTEPDHEVLNDVVEKVNEAWLDLEHMRQVFEKQARAEGVSDIDGQREYATTVLLHANMGVDELLKIEFRDRLNAVGVFVTTERACNVFDLVFSEEDVDADISPRKQSISGREVIKRLKKCVGNTVGVSKLAFTIFALDPQNRHSLHAENS